VFRREGGVRFPTWAGKHAGLQGTNPAERQRNQRGAGPLGANDMETPWRGFLFFLGRAVIFPVMLLISDPPFPRLLRTQATVLSRVPESQCKREIFGAER